MQLKFYEMYAFFQLFCLNSNRKMGKSYVGVLNLLSASLKPIDLPFTEIYDLVWLFSQSFRLPYDQLHSCFSSRLEAHGKRMNYGLLEFCLVYSLWLGWGTETISCSTWLIIIHFVGILQEAT